MSTFKQNHLLTQDLVRRLLRYDKRTGIFRWRVSFNRISAGDIAGSETDLQYIRITVGGHRIMAHVLAWLYVTGEYAPRKIDHVDTIGTNNRWRNLRKASASQNNMNQSLRSDNRLGVKGVRIRVGKISRPYYATIKSPGEKQRHLGYFDTLEEAAAAYRSAAERQFGSFARMA